MGMHRMPLLGALALTVAAAQTWPKEKKARRAKHPLGPPHPKSRQQRRAMERASYAALARLTHTDAPANTDPNTKD